MAAQFSQGLLTAPNTGTIFDSPWFAFERPAFKSIASWSDEALTMAIIAVAAFLAFLALYPQTPTIVKAVIFTWIVLP